MGQQRRPPQRAREQNQIISEQDFDKLTVEAKMARESDRVDEAIELYRRAVAARSQWAEGWWYLATLYYDRDNYAEGARAFKQVAHLQPRAGAPLVMLGLCEFQLAHYEDAAVHIEQGKQLGIGENAELARVIRYHEGLISLLKGEFEKAQVALDSLSYEGLNSADLIIALGLSMLRMGMLPKQVDVNYRDRAVVQRAGLAEHFNAQKNLSDAIREYELLVKDFPTFPGVQYAYGRFLLANRDEEAALKAFQRELQNSPKHSLARLQIAFIKLNNKDAAGGLPYAEEGTKLNPRLPLSHYILGRLLLDVGQSARAVEELETASQFAPGEPKIYFALIRAYTKANRKADAERAREIFTRLNQKSEANVGRGTGGAIPEDIPSKDKQAQP